MEKTKTQNQQTNNAEKNIAYETTVISMTPGAKDMVLEFADHHHLAYIIMCKDQKGSDIIKFTHSKEQQWIIDTINAFVIFFEKVVAELKIVAEPILKIISAEWNILTEHLTLAQDRKKQIEVAQFDKEKTNIQTNGN